MSQSDWNFTLNLAEATTFIGGTSGSAVEHVSMSNPITSSGDWCRGFYGSSGGSSRAAVSMVPINNSELTNSAGYEYGYGYSARMWVRMEDVGVGGNVCGFSLIFKGKSDLDINYTSPWSHQHTGYYLTFKQATANGLVTLYCKNEASTATADSLEPINNNYGFEHDVLYISNSVWKRIRMDVSPISGAYDKISIYTGSQTEGDWSQVYTVNIPRTKVGAYIPWANNPNGDGANAAGKGYMGVVVFSNNVTKPVFIDGFEVYKEVTALP